jgi:hypothetical protein
VNSDAVAATKAGMCAARMPRDRFQMPKPWQPDDHDSNFASSAWPRQLFARKSRQPGTVTAQPSKGNDYKPWNDSRQSCSPGKCTTTRYLDRPAALDKPPQLVILDIIFS